MYDQVYDRFHVCSYCGQEIELPIETRCGIYCSERCAELHDIEYDAWLETKGLL